MSVVAAGTALHLRVAAMGLHRAGIDLARTVERLCTHDLAEHERAEGTKRLYVALDDIRQAVTKVAERADAGRVDPELVAREC
jgi:hypothetical protein